jgi:predicted membrane protein
MEITRPISNRTFMQRLRSNTLWWGVPMLCAELIGAPRQLWGWIAILALPGTVAGVLIWTLLEHYAIARRNSN